MKMRKMFWILSVWGVVCCGAGRLSGDDWQVEIGGSYRHFAQPEFSGRAGKGGAWGFSCNKGERPGALHPLEHVVRDVPDGGVHRVIQCQFGDAGDKARGDYAGSDGLSPVVSVSRRLIAWKNWELSLVSNFQWYSLQTSAALSGMTDEISFLYVENHVASPSISLDWLHGEEGIPYPEGSTAGDGRYLSSRLNAWGKVHFSTEAYVLDIGGSLRYALGKHGGMSIAAGPSLTLVDFSLSGWRQSALGHVGHFSKNDRQLIPGIYCSCRGEYWFTEQYGVSLAVRYDCAGDVNNRYVRQKISSWSSQLQFLCRF